MKDRKIRGFIISIVMLMAGMTIGFALLAIAYTGPGWKAFIVLAAYLIISCSVIVYSVRYVRYLKNRKG